MKILRLEAKNVQRLSVVEIIPKGNVVEIAGNNAQGKTSVLRAIEWALAGTDTIAWEPIRKGEEQAKITVDLGEGRDLKLRVTRVFHSAADSRKPFTSYLKVENAAGVEQRGPQTLLDAITGAIAFDPLEFARMKAGDQASTLKRLVPDFDFAGHEKRRQTAYDTRREKNREADRLRKSIEADDPQYEGLPPKPIDLDAIKAKVREAVEARDAIARERQEREKRAQEVDDLLSSATDNDVTAERIRAQIGELTTRLDDVLRNAAAMRSEAAELAAAYNRLPPLGEPPDYEAATLDLEKAMAVNSAIAERGQWERRKAELAELEAESDRLTRSIERIDNAIRTAIEDADIPVRGLTLDSDRVLLNGLPFDQASTAEQLRASIALGIFANPTLKVMTIREGSLLDDAAMELLAEVAADVDHQIWIERIHPATEDAFVLEDGHVAGGSK